MTTDQVQLLDEMIALTKAWADRGVKSKDCVIAMITILAETCANNGFPIALATDSLGRAFAGFMAHKIAAHENNKP